MPIIKIKVGRGVDARFFQRLVDDFFSNSLPTIVLSNGWSPKVDIYETDDSVFIVADLAGVDKDSLLVTVEGQYLCLSGKRIPPKNHPKRFYQLEIEYGAFERVLRLPGSLNLDLVDAQYEQGLLTIKIAKKRNEETIKIPIK